MALNGNLRVNDYLLLGLASEAQRFLHMAEMKLGIMKMNGRTLALRKDEWTKDEIMDAANSLDAVDEMLYTLDKFLPDDAKCVCHRDVRVIP